VLRLRISGAIPLLLPCTLIACRGTLPYIVTRFIENRRCCSFENEHPAWFTRHVSYAALRLTEAITSLFSHSPWDSLFIVRDVTGIKGRNSLFVLSYLHN
jgi:hypothetical protein